PRMKRTCRQSPEMGTQSTPMQLFDIAPTATHRCVTGDADVAPALVACLGTPDFHTAALAQLNRAMPLGWWSVYDLFDGVAPPAMHLAASHGVPDGTAASWRAYRAGLYQRDETFQAARERARSGRAVLTHWRASEIRGPHRARIYERHGLRERVSLVSSEANDTGGLLAVNFYRTDTQPAFADTEIDRLRALAPLLLACVRRQLQWAPAGCAAPHALAALGGREREVCVRLLKGWTHEGIAADLGVSAGTVKTYRDRAFARLNVRHRNELFALAAGTLG
ncbi:MAG: LuxR family transcriptional regulator, partial [Lysobacteraceae bacterium]